MTWGKCLTAAGLVLNMVGALLLWYYLPDHSIARIYDDATKMTPVGRVAKIAKPAGWTLLIAGFLLQLVGLFL